MTDRFKGCVVTFDRDIREDDVEPLLTALRMLKGVVSVETSVVDPEDHMNRSRIRREMEKKIWGALYPEMVGK